MANVIKHKRGSGSDPTASNLVIGELAIRTDNGKLFTKMDSGAIAEIAGGGSDIAINTLSSSSATGGGSATFNGSAYRFTLSSPPSVSAAQLLVSVNGVIQKPVAGTGQPSEGFSVDGNDIIFGDAPATGSDFFILTFRSLGVSEPADNSVTSAKIVDGAIVNADINASAAIDVSKLSGVLPLAGGTLTGNLSLTQASTPTLTIDATNLGGVPKIKLQDGYNRNNFISIDDNGDNLIFAVDEDNNGGTSTIRHRIDGVEVARITRNQSNSTITHALVGNVDVSSGLDVTGAITGTGDMTIDTNTLHVDSSNNRVGIGTTSPSSLFNVDGGSANSVIEIDGTGRYRGFEIHEGGTRKSYLQHDATDNLTRLQTLESKLVFLTSDVEQMRLSGSNLGIGTTSPNRIIHAASTGHPYIKCESTNTTGAGIEVKDTAENWLIQADGGVGPGLAFYDLGRTSYRMIIDSSGRLLLGTTTEGNSSADNFTIADSGESGITVRSGTNNGGHIYFSDATSGTAEYQGLVSYQHNGDFMKFGTSATERMRIDSSGRLLINGTDANAVHTNADDVIIGNTSASLMGLSIVTSTSGYATLQFSDGGGNKNQGQIAYNHSNNSMLFTTAESTAMTIDSSGHFTLGRDYSTNPSNVLTGVTTVRGHCVNTGTTDNDFAQLYLKNSSSSGNSSASIRGYRDDSNFKTGLRFYTHGNPSSGGDGDERMRISSNGDVRFGTTDAIGTGVPGAEFDASNGAELRCGITGSGNSTQIRFFNANGEVGAIRTNGSATVYHTSSDYRRKENAVAISDGITRLKALKPYKFNFKADPRTILDGFFAHEVSPVVPEAISGTKDEVDENNEPVYQGIDQSKLVPLLTAALQEAIGRIEALEAK